MKLNKEDKQEALKVILQKILQNTCHTILLEMRFLDVALTSLEIEPNNEIPYLSTDGKKMYYNELKVIESFKISPQKVAHDMIHVIFHCVLLHLFYTKVKIPLWDLSCDIAVEQLIGSMEIPCLKIRDDELKRRKLEFFQEQVKPFTPQNVLKFLQEQNYSEARIIKLKKIFTVDSHDEWDKVHTTPDTEGEGDGAGYVSVTLYEISWDELMNTWKKVGTIVLINMQSFSKLQGDKAGNLVQELEQLTRETYDYSKFLKKFAVRKEINKINEDEFDYIFYTYGLNHYKRMPLIEPLEYKDELVIRDFVIAIDTSGSTSGEIVQKFLQKTYNILKSTESFSKKVNIYIIQCDADIQEVKQITSEDALEQYIKEMTIKGLGGTDFRPVFTLVNTMRKEKKFTKLKGLIYFTDGYGMFPTEKTVYDTAFVFVDQQDFQDVTVPSWAMKVLLSEDTIQEM